MECVSGDTSVSFANFETLRETFMETFMETLIETSPAR